MLQQILTDVRYGLRLLRRSPGFGATLLAILVVGIGATTAMFSLVLSILVRPLPYPHPEELTMMWGKQPQAAYSPISITDYLDWKARATTISSMAIIGYQSVSLSAPGGEPEHLSAASVSGEFFPMLGIGPLHGRLLGPDDDRLRGPKVAVISAASWRRRFGADPGVVGRTVILNGEPYSIVGVVAEGFHFSGPYLDHCDVWTPFAVSEARYEQGVVDSRSDHSFHAIGRRKSGVTLEQAQAEISAIAKSIGEAHPDTNAHFGANLRDLHESLVSSNADSLWTLFAATGAVFLIVCANVANLLLARFTARRSEMATRAAVGASPARLVAQVLTETVSLFVVAALLGGLFARWIVDTVASRLVSADGAATIDVRVDGMAFAFAVGTSLVFGLAFGLVPALEAKRVAPQSALKESGARASLGRSTRAFRSGLVIAQVALAFALLVGSGVFVRHFVRMASAPLGFDGANVVTAVVISPRDEDAKLSAFWREILAKVAAEPGVSSVGANSSLPFWKMQSNNTFQVEGHTPWPQGTGPLLERNVVDPGYLRTMGIPILRGRGILDSDVEGSRRVVVISQSVAARYFPGEDPVGRRISFDGTRADPWREIVGVAGDVSRDGGGTHWNEAYMPLAEHGADALVIVARTDRPEELRRRIRGIVASIDPTQAIASLRLMDERVADELGPQRFMAGLLGAFALTALVLATLGIFGLVSYTTTQRTREIGIRVALGASPEGVMVVVMRDGLRLLGIGLVAGLLAAVLLGRAIAGRVAGIGGIDAPVTAAIFAVLALVGTLAALLPALRAVRIPPAVALRYE